MKILICIPCLYMGGTEIQTLNLVRALVEAGHHITTVCYFEYAERMVISYRAAGSDVIILSREGKRINGWKGFLFLYKGLQGVLRREKPDWIHVQYMAPGAIPIIILRLLGIKKIIVTTHTAADIYPNLKLVHFIQRHCVYAFTCITRKAEESFFGSSQMYTSQTVLGRRNHFTIYNALSPHIKITNISRCFSGNITLGVVSRLERIKGMDLVIPAFARVKMQYMDVKLIIVGDGTLRNEMWQQAEALEVNKSVVWMGMQEQDTLQMFYDKIDILLIPSRSEGFGLTAIEGMARGCVVVAADTGGLPEVVRNGEVGVLHQKDNLDDMVANINLLLANREYLMRLSRNTYSYVSHFSFANYASAFRDLYERIK